MGEAMAVQSVATVGCVLLNAPYDDIHVLFTTLPVGKSQVKRIS